MRYLESVDNITRKQLFKKVCEEDDDLIILSVLMLDVRDRAELGDNNNMFRNLIIPGDPALNTHIL